MSAWVFRPWFEEQPDRFEYELERLRASGWTFEVDTNAMQNGRLVLRGRVSDDDGERLLMVVFPDTYPEHRVEIYDLTDDSVFPLHQHPYDRNLCLLDNLPDAWTPNNDDAAWMVHRALELHKAAKGGVTELERIGVGAPEPQSYYYPYGDDTSILIPETMLNVEGDFGRFEFKTLIKDIPFRGILGEVYNRSGLAQKAPDELLELFSGIKVRGAWFRLNSHPPFMRTADEFRIWANDNVPDFERNLRKHAKACQEFPGLRLLTFAFVYPDQGPDGTHDTWLVCVAESGEKRRRINALLRFFIMSSQDQERRIAPIAGLRGKKVAVVGLGTVGAPLALELARTGLLGELLLVDYDYYTVWNLVRHPLSLIDLGLNKAEAIARRVRLYAPQLKTKVAKIRIGQALKPERGGWRSEAKFLAELHGFDLIIDATADGGTTRFLNRFSLQSGIPLIAASVTEGGWGGEVVRSIPGVTGCYECYLWSVKDGSVPKPSQNPKQTQVFTRGCGFPTFVGTGFDALALAADAARLAVQTLLRDEPDAYPNAPNDVLVRHNRSAGNTDHPQYESARLPIHHRCAWHQSIES